MFIFTNLANITVCTQQTSLILSSSETLTLSALKSIPCNDDFSTANFWYLSSHSSNLPWTTLSVSDNSPAFFS